MKLDVIPNLFRNLTVDKTLKQVQGDKNYLPLNRIAGLLTAISNERYNKCPQSADFLCFAFI